MSTSPAIVAENLVFDYPTHRALHGVSLAVERGSVTALVGPNGAGKTTLMSCLAALQRPLHGSVCVDGVDMLEQPRLGHRRIGYLKDFFGLYDSLSVRQTLWHAARSHRIPSAECPAVVARVAEDLNLEHLMGASAGTLSRGQRQRLAIARTMVHRPPVLLLDEPASGLDPEARHELAALMRRLQADGMTLLVSSHILSELEEYSSAMIIIRDGRLLEQRTFDDPGVRCWLRMEMYRPLDATPAVLANHPAVSEPRLDAGDVVFAFGGDGAARNALLRACLEAEVPVSGLTESNASLEDEYLKQLRAARDSEAPVS